MGDISYRGSKLSYDEYVALHAAQKGLCAACGKPEKELHKGKVRALAVDHDHKTGKIRGLLCGGCNRALGLLHEDVERIKALLLYLESRCIAEYNVHADIAQNMPEYPTHSPYIDKIEKLFGL